MSGVQSNTAAHRSQYHQDQGCPRCCSSGLRIESDRPNEGNDSEQKDECRSKNLVDFVGNGPETKDDDVDEDGIDDEESAGDESEEEVSIFSYSDHLLSLSGSSRDSNLQSPLFRHPNSQSYQLGRSLMPGASLGLGQL